VSVTDFHDANCYGLPKVSHVALPAAASHVNCAYAFVDALPCTGILYV
jgi:hypothetical protein